MFWYDAVTPAAQSVLAAVYDGPYDFLNFNNQSVILEKVPALSDGDVRLEPSPVQPGEWVAGAQGDVVVLAEGVSYRPAGCAAPECARLYSGTGPVDMDQLVVQFHLKPGLTWSDGSALTAGDSLYSYEVAAALQPEAWRELLQVTAAYLALDERSVEWRGLPGYLAGDYARLFYVPLPRHAWGSLSPSEVRSVAGRAPLGWGPYQLETWTAGVQIVLRKNPAYFRAGEGLPNFDRLVFRLVEDSAAALQGLRNRECDLVDPSAVAEAQLPQLLELQAAGEVQLMPQLPTAWEQITLGMVSYSRPAVEVFAQAQVRQAAVLCIDRQAITRLVLGGLAQEAHTFLPPGHPDSLASSEAAVYDPHAGGQRLSAAGWLDLDGDPATPRTAESVAGIPDGDPLAVQYLVSPDSERQAVAQAVQEGLEACGFGVEIVTRPFGEYLAPGPAGLVFGRQFDMAQFAWPSALQDLCRLYLSSEIPGPYPEFPKGWGGGNASGYNNPAFDQACQAALTSLPDSPERSLALRQAQELLLQDAPVIPLYWRFTLALAHPGVCGLAPQVHTPNPFWNIEAFDMGEACGGS